MPDQGQVATDGIIKTEVVEIIKRLKQESKSARYPRECEWNEAWNLYNNTYDFSRKADWQSKNALPRVNTAVRSGAYLLKKGLVGQRDFFKTDGIGPISKQVAPYAHKLTKFHLNQGKFVDNYVTSVMSGMLCSLVVMKVYPTMEEYDEISYDWPKGGPALPKAPPPPDRINMVGDVFTENQRIMRKTRKRLCIKYDPVSAYDYFPDPYNEGMYKIHTIDMDFYKFQQMERDGKFKAGMSKLLSEEFVDLEKVNEEAARAGQFVPNSTSMRRKRVQLDEFWGTLVNPSTGEVLFKNCYAVMVNEKYMAVDPKPSPLLSMGVADPFVVAPIIEKPFSTWHQGFVEHVTGLAKSLTDLMNLMLDGNMYASIKAFELDIDQVYNPTDFQGGIFPGKVFAKRSGGMQNAPMIKDISLGNFNPQVVELFIALDREFQNGVALNEFIAPQMRSRTGRATATEVMVKGQNSADFFGEIAKCQEEKMIDPTLLLTYKYSLHYQRDFTDPLLLEVLGPEAAAKAQIMLADPEMREFLISNPMKFMAGGMSEVTNRMRELDKVMAFINLIGNVGKVVPAIFTKVNLGSLMQKAIEALNWDEGEIMNMEGPIPPSAGIPGGGPAPAGQPTAGMPPVAPPNPSIGMRGGQGQIASVLGG